MKNECTACAGHGSIYLGGILWWAKWRKCTECGGDGYAKPPGWPSVQKIRDMTPAPSPPPPMPHETGEAYAHRTMKRGETKPAKPETILAAEGDSTPLQLQGWEPFQMPFSERNEYKNRHGAIVTVTKFCEGSVWLGTAANPHRTLVGDNGLANRSKHPSPTDVLYQRPIKVTGTGCEPPLGVSSPLISDHLMGHPGNASSVAYAHAQATDIMLALQREKKPQTPLGKLFGREGTLMPLPAPVPSAWIAVQQMIAANARHKSKGYSLADMKKRDIVGHMRGEVDELREAIIERPYSIDRQKDEAADVWGTLIHLAIDLGMTFEEMNDLAIKKFAKRFETPVDLTKTQWPAP